MIMPKILLLSAIKLSYFYDVMIRPRPNQKQLAQDMNWKKEIQHRTIIF